VSSITNTTETGVNLTAHLKDAIARLKGESVNAMFVCDFPPSNFRGGPLLISRLLSMYPTESLLVVSGSHLNRLSPPDARLSCEQRVFPTTSGTGRLGLGRLKALIDWLLIPLLAIYLVILVKKRATKVLLTVADGHFFLAVSIASWVTRVPMILFVHDDWVSGISQGRHLFKAWAPRLFRKAGERASNIYAVSPAMQSLLKTTYGLESEVQLPAPDGSLCEMASASNLNKTDRKKIVFSGTGTGVMRDGLDLLIRLVKSDCLETHGDTAVELHIYMTYSPERVRELGWDHERVIFHGWQEQGTVHKALIDADVLFLPFSFKEEHRFATLNAFPTKTADYLASGNAILILAPAYSGLVNYAREFRFAEVVDKLDQAALLEGLIKVLRSSEYREALKTNAKLVLQKNHSIERQRLQVYERILELKDAQESSRAGSIPVGIRESKFGDT